MTEMSTIFVDGQPVAFQQGEPLLEAARRAGAEVPTLCYEPRVEPAGSCRLCLVQVEGRAQPVAACTFPAAEGLRVVTRSADLDVFRRRLLELTLSDLPGEECRHCAEIAPCGLHSLADRYGASRSRFRGAVSGQTVDDGNPFILRDYSRCILCYRCTRVCNELEQAHAIAPAGHGFTTRIDTLFGRGLAQSPCTFCGQCVHTCPTGALADLSRMGRAKATEIERSVQTVCGFCGTGCTLYLDVSAGRVVGVRPDPSSPVSRGSLCIKGQFGWEFVHSPDRLTTPLVRREGRLQPATWDEAYDVIAERLGSIKDSFGADALAFWSSARATNEANYLFQKFARAVIGTNNVDNCART